MINKNKKIYLEIVVVNIILTVITILLGENPGFYKQDYIYFWIVPTFFVIFYGNRYLYFSIIMEFVFMFLSLFISIRFINNIDNFKEAKIYTENLIPSISIGLFLLFITSIFVHRYEYKVKTLITRLQKTSLDKLHYKRSSSVLEIVNKELETQLNKSSTSITALYSHLYNIDKLNKKYLLDTILDTIVQFTGVTKATIWEFNNEFEVLDLAAAYGHKKGDIPTKLRINNTIEGFVYRNNQFFTIRKLHEFNSLTMNESRHNIMTYPIHVGNESWGVLNIEDIPFDKYSSYNEQLIKIVIDLSKESLKNAIFYEASLLDQDLDKETGIPLFTQLYNYLDNKLSKDWEENHIASIIILEIKNYSELCKSHGLSKVIEVLKKLLIKTFNDYSLHNYVLFKYKRANQFTLLLDNLDNDGLAYYIVTLFKNINDKHFIEENYNIHFEIGVGYATQNNKKRVTAEELLEEAESLLQLSEF